jgi:O-antigen/teichoic acid export membrane protein
VSGRGGLGRRLVSESAVYGLGGIANQALTIILVPIYARVLGEGGMGVVAVINATLSLSLLVATLALPQAFFRAYLRDSDTDAERRRVLAGTFGLRLAVSLAFLALYSVASVPLTGLVFGDMADLPLLLLIGPIVFLDSLNLVPLSFLRAARQPRAYALISFGRAVLGSVLIIAFVVALDLGPLGVVLGSVGSALVTATIGMAIYLRRTGVGPRWDGGLNGSMLAFSLPLVPAALAGWGLNLADRYVLNAFRGLDEVGVYSVGYTGGLVINALAIAPFTLAWGAAYWEIGRSEDAPRVFRRVLTLFTIGASAGALALTAIGTDAIRLLLTPGFDDARFIVPFSAFGMVLYGVYQIVATGLNLASRTRVLPFTMGAAAIVNVALNLLLVPGLGMIGAGIATIVGYLVLAVATAAAGQRHYPVAWDVPRVVAALALGAGLGVAALLGPDSILWRLACLVAYAVAVPVLRIIEPDDVRRVRSAVSRRLASARGR